MSSVNHKTKTPNSNYEIEDIISQSFERLSKKVARVIVILDEPDFLEPEKPDNWLSQCQRIKEVIPKAGLLVLVHRDSKNYFTQEFCDTNSLTRSTFDHHEPLQLLWEPGKGNIRIILEPRFLRGKPAQQFVFPLSEGACLWIDTLSSSNMREMLRYTRSVLQKGMITEETIPLSKEFVLNALVEEFPELRIESEDELKVLFQLKKQSASVSDEQFQKEVTMSRTSLQRHLKSLEQRWLVERDTISRGRKKQTYSLTKKAELLLRFHYQE